MQEEGEKPKETGLPQSAVTIEGNLKKKEGTVGGKGKKMKENKALIRGQNKGEKE